MKDIDSISRNTALAYACIIYHKANIPDTALMYANELIQKDQLNRRTGYQIALASDMLKYLPKDSLLHYISKYRDAMETDLSQNGIQEALIQNSFYNYQLHQRERIKAETANESLHKWIIAILLIVFALTVCVLYLKYRNKSQLVQLHEAINNVNILRQALESDKNSANETATGHASTSESNTALQLQSVQDLRARLRDGLLSLRNNGGNTSDISPIILNSEAYETILQHIKTGKVIPETNALWDELEETVIQSSPDFKHRLRLLAGGKLKASEFHLALLIKCGMTLTNMAILIGRTKAAIAYRRDVLGLKVFDQKIEANVISDIVRLL